MPTITIDNQQVEVPAGATVLDAAEKLGIEIPSLCFLKGYEPSTSCLVCVVRNRQTGPVRAGVRHARRGRHADGQRDGGGECHAPHGAGTAVERPCGRLPGAVLLRLPGAHGYPADAAADRRAERARGDRHDQAGHRPAGGAGTRLSEALRERMPAQCGGQSRGRLRTEAVCGGCGSGEWRSLSAARAGPTPGSAWRLSVRDRPAWPRPTTCGDSDMPVC